MPGFETHNLDCAFLAAYFGGTGPILTDYEEWEWLSTAGIKMCPIELWLSRLKYERR